MQRRHFLMLTLAASAWRPAPAQGIRPAALIVGIYGRLEIDRGAEHLLGKIRMPLFAGDLLVTDARSKAVILLNDGSEVKLNSDTRVKFPPKGKALKVEEGEIFASMKPQKTPFLIQVPSGTAGIEGTEFNVKVAKVTLQGAPGRATTLTVADGKVKFSNMYGRAVRVLGGDQSTLTLPGDNRGVDASFVPTAPVKVDVAPIVRWSKAVKKYIEAMTRLRDLYQQIDADAKARGGFLSPELVAELNRVEDEVRGLVADEEFAQGHRDMLAAFNSYKMTLALTDPQQKENVRQQADAAYSRAASALQRYTQKYQKELDQFLKG